eukprot:5485831-Pyramimonas_sp.AAC.2
MHEFIPLEREEDSVAEGVGRVRPQPLLQHHVLTDSFPAIQEPPMFPPAHTSLWRQPHPVHPLRPPLLKHLLTHHSGTVPYPDDSHITHHSGTAPYPDDCHIMHHSGTAPYPDDSHICFKEAAQGELLLQAGLGSHLHHNAALNNVHLCV